MAAKTQHVAANAYLFELGSYSTGSLIEWLVRHRKREIDYFLPTHVVISPTETPHTSSMNDLNPGEDWFDLIEKEGPSFAADS